MILQDVVYNEKSLNEEIKTEGKRKDILEKSTYISCMAEYLRKLNSLHVLQNLTLAKYQLRKQKAFKTA